jgi:uncharacterized protein
VIIDAHTHVWPDAIAAKALDGPVPDLQRHGDGRVGTLAEVMDREGIDMSVCLAVANRPAQVDAANRFVAGLDRKRFIPFGSVHAGLSPEANTTSLRDHGLRGAKVHALYQSYNLDDPGLLATLDAMQGEFAVIVHVGAGGTADENSRCTPAMLRRIVELFPRLKVVACHFGGYRLLDEAEEVIVGQRVHLDTAWPPSVAEIDPARLRRLIERHGPDRVVFASDWPMASPGREVAAIRALGFADDITEGILGGNLLRLLGLEPAAAG